MTLEQNIDLKSATIGFSFADCNKTSVCTIFNKKSPFLLFKRGNAILFKLLLIMNSALKLYR
jgi:hypothetical protein